MSVISIRTEKNKVRELERLAYKRCHGYITNVIEDTPENKDGEKILRITKAIKMKTVKQQINRPLTIREMIRVKKQSCVMSKSEETWLKLQLQYILNGKPSLLGPYGGIDGAWKDEPCFVLGGSTGMRNAMTAGFRFDMLDGYHTIAANHVVEDYHNAEWLIALDERFFKLCKWEVLKEYQGKIFTTIKAKAGTSEKLVIIYPTACAPTAHIIDGVYSFSATGISAIHLAIISGANPIYLMGLDNGGKEDGESVTHYKDDYDPQGLDTPEAIAQGRKNTAGWMKYKTRIPRMCDRFAQFAYTVDENGNKKARILNVDPLGDIQTFKKISVLEIPELEGKFV